MKVLFAVNNDEISEAIIKRYQKDYKEILSYKNVYYFNAILKELQKDKSYDRLVISEDLEPFANNNYDTIDKFLFDRLDSISDEATDNERNNVEIVLICNDRRSKSDEILVKYFGIGIYGALIGQDRKIDNVCKLINKPRSKKEAKYYYKIDVENVNYQSEDENNVSEAEVQNILAHYKRLGKDEEKYVDSFNNIVSQYNDNQLKIIISCLPIGVKAVLEEKSPKYQSLMAYTRTITNANSINNTTSRKLNQLAKERSALDIKMIEKGKTKLTKPVVIPSGLNKNEVRKLIKETPRTINTEERMRKVENTNLPEEEIRRVQNNNNVVKEKIKENENINLAGEPTRKIENTNSASEPTRKTEKSNLENIDAILEQISEIETTRENNTTPIEENALDTIIEEIENNIDENKEETIENNVEQVKRGRGRPRKVVPVELEQVDKPKRGRGRPRKNPLPEEIQEVEANSKTETETNNSEIDLFDLDNNENQKEKREDTDLFGLSNEEENQEEVDLFGLNDEEEEQEDTDLFGLSNEEEKQEEVDLFGLNDEEEDTDLFGLSNEEENQEDTDLFGLSNEEENQEDTDLFGLRNEEENQEDTDLFGLNNEEQQENDDLFNLNNEQNQSEIINSTNNMYNEDNYSTPNDILLNNSNTSNSNYSSLLSKDKKVITFVGTTKNGTSFVVNNLAELLASMGIKTAVLDLTQSKNAFYIYTNNEERLRNLAEESIEKLKSGIANGITPNKNLGIYTALPTEKIDYSNADAILSTLVKNNSVVLIDCDFETPLEYFEKAQEIFLVQSMDVLTIQPLTAFLRNLKSKGILKQEKIKVVINKFQKVKSLSAKTLIGGIAYYNDPGMSYMTELFNKDIVPYCIVPFEMQNYVKYLESLAVCSITLNGYTKDLISALKDLANLTYPLIGKQTYYPRGEKYKDNFSEDMNNTLNKMKKYQ